MLKIDNLIDDAKCFESVRRMRWPNGVKCANCGSVRVIKRGRDEHQRYHCNSCRCDFDDLTNTIFAHHHQPLRKWILFQYLMGLNLSNLSTSFFARSLGGKAQALRAPSWGLSRRSRIPLGSASCSKALHLPLSVCGLHQGLVVGQGHFALRRK
jgi:transposase-like protein